MLLSEPEENPIGWLEKHVSQQECSIELTRSHTSTVYEHYNGQICGRTGIGRPDIDGQAVLAHLLKLTLGTLKGIIYVLIGR